MPQRWSSPRALTGSGYRARVYARLPGDPAFRPANGPAFESTVTIGEVESPLGAPGFAFAIDSRGAITGFADFVAGASAFTARPCPASGRSRCTSATSTMRAA